MHMQIKMREGYIDSGILQAILGSFSERLPFEVVFEEGAYHITLALVKPHDPFFDMVSDIIDVCAGVNQSLEASFISNFSIDDMFKKDAPPIKDFFMKGMAAQLQFCTWGGLKYFFRDMFRAMKEDKDESKVAMAKMILPLVPLFFFKATGKFDVNLDEDILKDFLGVDKTEMIFKNAHTIISEKALKTNNVTVFDDLDIIT